jgi:hypothetical protein
MWRGKLTATEYYSYPIHFHQLTGEAKNPHLVAGEGCAV